MLAWVSWDPAREIFRLPFIHLPIYWYSFFFALGFLGGYHFFRILVRRYLSNFSTLNDSDLNKYSKKIADKFLFYMIVATVLGARIGHLLFYETPSYYLSNPLVILQTWQGGLSSHGAAIAIIIMIFLFVKVIKKEFPFFSNLMVLDLVAMPTAFAAIFIRIGNFFNQEILGKVTTVPWGIIFLNPADNGPIAPRHPTQLYEGFSYLIIFIMLFILSRRPSFFFSKGKMIGLFFILIFGVRFVIEFFKVNESHLLMNQSLLMGQYLSIPFILLGSILFYVGSRITNNA